MRSRHHTVASPLAGAGSADFSKHLVDGAHSYTWVWNHYPFDVDTRFNAGWITSLCSGGDVCGVPIAERFFAGNVEHNFLLDRSWVIRSQPLLRSLPWNGLSKAAAGHGRGAAATGR